MSTEPERKLHEMLEEFGVAMLVTRADNGRLHARPMVLAEVQADGTLWFVTDRHSGKVEDIVHNAQVAVTMQSTTKFVSFSGVASQVEDRAKIAKLWRTTWKVWFPGGKDDPSLILLKVDAEGGEYWDNSGVSGIKYLIQAGKALLTGTRPDVGSDPKTHGKVG